MGLHHTKRNVKANGAAGAVDVAIAQTNMGVPVASRGGSPVVVGTPTLRSAISFGS